MQGTIEFWIKHLKWAVAYFSSMKISHSFYANPTVHIGFIAYCFSPKDCIAMTIQPKCHWEISSQPVSIEDTSENSWKLPLFHINQNDIGRNQCSMNTITLRHPWYTNKQSSHDIYLCSHVIFSTEGLHIAPCYCVDKSGMQYLCWWNIVCINLMFEWKAKRNSYWDILSLCFVQIIFNLNGYMYNCFPW